MAVTMLPDGHYSADDTADIEKLTDMVETLLKAVWGSDWGIFSEDSPTGFSGDDSDSTKIKLPHITHDLVSRVPMEDRTVKWTAFDSFPDPENPGHNITMYKQWFECELQFDLYHKTKKEARRLAQRFEEFMNTYIGYFKKQGVQEIIFLSEESPKTESFARQEMAKRTLTYYVRIERISAVRSAHLKQIADTIKVGDEPLEFTLPDSEPQPAPVQAFQSSSSNELAHKGSNDFLSLYKKHY